MEWEAFESAVTNWLENRKNDVGSFASDAREDEKYWRLTREIPMPPMETAPVLILPLNIHIARGDYIGCSLTNEECYEELCPRINELWAQAGIAFDLNEIIEHEWPSEIKNKSMSDIRKDIWGLHRDPVTRKMTGKELRRDLFMNHIIGSERHSVDTYDIWVFDFVGQESQGCCIDRSSHTVIVGRRSTKGYLEPTERPLNCLGKTCAHELGHALGLNHPRGMRFSDGTPCDVETGRNNLMTGGKDISGGGGELLSAWQIMIARKHAVTFLQC